ncbi:MAG: ParB/RepB/Spo0J family partition protein [Myxococcales bacterium]|nr:ParB/RepB/Spo0J family partition protein [Myxococcales bacterium]MCB9702535.1 ParB/RepB/Spo0J family partition protein [Myxococcales bacterium]
MSTPPKRALGRGLGALIPGASPREAPPAGPAPTGLRTLAIESLRPGPGQPRKRFEEARLRELAESVRLHGILQPIVVSATPGSPGEYSIIAGERRWRAAQIAGLHEVPVVIRSTPESDHLELALVENLQREDLDPIEEARALRQLMDVRGCTQDALAERVGKDRSTIANTMRLLKLPEKVQAMVQDGVLGMGHARALLSLDDPAAMIDLAQETVRTGMSVRAVERAVRAKLRPAEPEVEADPEAEKHRIIVRELEQRLRRSLGAKVKLREQGAKAGTIEIPYQSLDELDRLLHQLLRDGE